MTDQPPVAGELAHHDCDACRSLDALDGVVDGHLFTPTAALKHVRNERTILRRMLRAQDRTADHVTSFAGSLNFVYIHAAWFAFWIAVNVGILGAALKFDDYPFGLLTMIVSLEAIFLSTVVMVSPKRQAARSDIRAQLDFETNLRAEIWAVHIGAALHIDDAHVEDVVRHAIASQNATAEAAG
jgi:uncharacterized membrane protein